MYDFEMLGVEEEADEGLRGREYDLRITFAPVDWMKVLNSFALDLVTYVIFYVMLGIGVCLFVTVVWGFFRLTAKSSTPPKLHFVMWWRSFEYYPVLGVMLASLPIVAACLWIGIVIRQLDIFGQVPGTLSAQAVATTADRSRWRSGRIGASVIVMGIYMLHLGTHLLVPRRDMPGSLWKPGYWQRKHCMFTAIWLFMLLLVVIQLSFTPIFGQNAQVFMLALKVFWIAMESVFSRTLNEMLIILPYQARFHCRTGSDKSIPTS